MRKTIYAAAGAAFALLPALALAQDQPAPAPGAGAAAPAAPAAGAAGAVPDVTADVIIAAANNMQSEITGISAVQAGATVHIVPITDLLAGPDGAALTTALQKDESEFTALRTAVSENGVLMGALGGEGLSVDKVVAIDINDQGEVFLFVQGA
jgi:hypothetical protein